MFFSFSEEVWTGRKHFFSTRFFFFFKSCTNIISCKIKEGLTREFLGSHYKIWTLVDIWRICVNDAVRWMCHSEQQKNFDIAPWQRRTFSSALNDLRRVLQKVWTNKNLNFFISNSAFHGLQLQPNHWNLLIIY